MKFILGLSAISIAVLGIISISSSADLEKGRALFTNPELGGGNVGMSCNSCHSEGKGLGLVIYQEKLKEIVNLCIQKDMNGIGIASESEKMINLITYIENLPGKAEITERIAGFECLE